MAAILGTALLVPAPRSLTATPSPLPAPDVRGGGEEPEEDPGFGLRRDPVVAFPGVGQGRLLVGIGFAHSRNSSFPVSGLRGHLTDVADVTVAYAPASRVVLRLRGESRRILAIRERGTSRIPLDPAVDDGRTAGAGDFRVSTHVRVVGDEHGLSGGVRLETKLPTSSQARGIGLNTTDFIGSLFASHGSARARLTADIGVGILEAPLQEFVQNDVLVYGAEGVVRPGGARLSLVFGLHGRANTRGNVPPGTESRGAARFGAEAKVGAWRLEGHGDVGYAGTSPDLRLSVGVSRSFRM